jgi:hypothetical protein
LEADNKQMIDLIISKRFEQHVGHKKIQRREYAIEEMVTGKKMNREYDWAATVRSGQKLDISVLFSDSEAASNNCPRCGAISTASMDAKIK